MIDVAAPHQLFIIFAAVAMGFQQTTTRGYKFSVVFTFRLQISPICGTSFF